VKYIDSKNENSIISESFRDNSVLKNRLA